MGHHSGGWMYRGERVKVISQCGNLVKFRVGDRELTLPRSELQKISKIKNGLATGHTKAAK